MLRADPTLKRMLRGGAGQIHGFVARVDSLTPRCARVKTSRYKSGLEEQYAAELSMRMQGARADAERVLWFGYECMKFRIAGGTYYTPDFVVAVPSGVEIHEVKGFMREAARVRWRACADLFPIFRWYVVKRAARRWSLEQYGGE